MASGAEHMDDPGLLDHNHFENPVTIEITEGGTLAQVCVERDRPAGSQGAVVPQNMERLLVGDHHLRRSVKSVLRRMGKVLCLGRLRTVSPRPSLVSASDKLALCSPSIAGRRELVTLQSLQCSCDEPTGEFPCYKTEGRLLPPRKRSTPGRALRQMAGRIARTVEGTMTDVIDIRRFRSSFASRPALAGAYAFALLILGTLSSDTGILENPITVHAIAETNGPGEWILVKSVTNVNNNAQSYSGCQSGANSFPDAITYGVVETTTGYTANSWVGSLHYRSSNRD